MMHALCLGLLFSSSCLVSSDNQATRQDKIQSLSSYRTTHHSTPYARPSFYTKKDKFSDDNETRRHNAVECALKKVTVEKAQAIKSQATTGSTVAAPVTAKKEEARDRQDQSSRCHTVVKKEVQGFIYDAFTQRRGTPKIISIFCRSCDNHIMNYQKDGPGRLLRCYSDRCIHCPLSAADRHFTSRTVHSAPRLQCPDCTTNIGHPMIYRGYGENRPAFHLNPNAFYIKN